MKFDLKKPCKRCPFRNDIDPYLRLSRADEIADNFYRGGHFSCHEHNSFDEDGEVIETENSQHCAGALIILEKMDMPNQLMRVSERIGCYDRTKLHMDSPVDECLDDWLDNIEANGNG